MVKNPHRTYGAFCKVWKVMFAETQRLAPMLQSKKKKNLYLNMGAVQKELKMSILPP